MGVDKSRNSYHTPIDQPRFIQGFGWPLRALRMSLSSCLRNSQSSFSRRRDSSSATNLSRSIRFCLASSILCFRKAVRSWAWDWGVWDWGVWDWGAWDWGAWDWVRRDFPIAKNTTATTVTNPSIRPMTKGSIEPPFCLSPRSVAGETPSSTHLHY